MPAQPAGHDELVRLVAGTVEVPDPHDLVEERVDRPQVGLPVRCHGEPGKSRQGAVQAAAIVAAAGALKTKLQELITAGKYREASVALEPTDIPSDQLRDPRVQAVLTEQGQAMANKAGKELAALQATFDKAKTAGNPDAMETALGELNKCVSVR